MRNSEDDHAVELEILKHRLENHREYVSRQWQYYATFILLNGLIITGVKDLINTNVKALALAFVITSAVFFHLIFWTKLRIHRNAAKINELARDDLIEIPKARESITLWLLISVTAFTLGWLIWIFSISWKIGLIGALSFALIVTNSLLSSLKAREPE